jgi:hypothetical protein
MKKSQKKKSKKWMGKGREKEEGTEKEEVGG